MCCMLYFFRGKEPVEIRWNLESFEMPVLWLFVMGGCLYMMLDYFLDDLTQGGQQILIRCGSRHAWFLSKCLWNLLGCCLYFFMAALTAWIFSHSLSGAFFGDMEQLMLVLPLRQTPTLSWEQEILATVIYPLLTLWAVSMLQMTLCLIVKPVISFLISLSLLTLSAYVSSPWILGNGAMSLRSALLGGDMDPGKAGTTALTAAAFCILLGMALFRKRDILDTEE